MENRECFSYVALNCGKCSKMIISENNINVDYVCRFRTDIINLKVLKI